MKNLKSKDKENIRKYRGKKINTKNYILILGKNYAN